MNGRLKIYFENEQSRIKVNYSKMILTRRAIEATLDFEDFGCDVEVSVTFTDNKQIREYNKEYRNIDHETDVLSFPLLSDQDNASAESRISLGDIVISLEKAKEQGELFGHGFDRELAFLCIHSTLHLLGYDHETSEEDELEMRRRQSAIASIIGLDVKEEVDN